MKIYKTLKMRSKLRNIKFPLKGKLGCWPFHWANCGQDLNKALEWASKAVEMNPDAFWMSRQKSLIQADLGDKKGAMATAKMSLAASQKAGNADYTKMNQESIAEWSK